MEEMVRRSLVNAAGSRFTAEHRHRLLSMFLGRGNSRQASGGRGPIRRGDAETRRKRGEESGEEKRGTLGRHFRHLRPLKIKDFPEVSGETRRTRSKRGGNPRISLAFLRAFSVNSASPVITSPTDPKSLTRRREGVEIFAEKTFRPLLAFPPRLRVSASRPRQDCPCAPR